MAQMHILKQINNPISQNSDLDHNFIVIAYKYSQTQENSLGDNVIAHFVSRLRLYL